MNGFYQGYDMPIGCLCQMCVSELCWTRTDDGAGGTTLIIDSDKVAYTVIEAGGGFLGET